jgi:hypothetical protein
MTNINPQPSSQSEGGLYLVVMDEMVVAEDLRGAILEWNAAAHVAIASNLSEAEQIVETAGRPLWGALVMTSPEAYLSSRLCEALAANGRQGILLGDDAERTGPGPRFRVLPRPFSTSDVHAQLVPPSPE